MQLGLATRLSCPAHSLQALLANMAAMYAVYHGPQGLKDIASRAHGLASVFAAGVQKLGVGKVVDGPFFDTVQVVLPDGKAQALQAAAAERNVNLRLLDSDPNTVSGSDGVCADGYDAHWQCWLAGPEPGLV